MTARIASGELARIREKTKGLAQDTLPLDADDSALGGVRTW